MDRGRPTNLDAVLSSITEHWSPRTFAVVNDYDARVVKVQVEFTGHRHPDTDELLPGLSGRLTIRMDGDAWSWTGRRLRRARGNRTSPPPTRRPPSCCSSPARRVNTGDTPSVLTAERRTV